MNKTYIIISAKRRKELTNMKTALEIKNKLEETRELVNQTWKALKESNYNSINNPYQEELFRLGAKIRKLEKEYQIASAMEDITNILKQVNEKYGSQKAIDVFNAYRKSYRFTKKRKEEMGLAVFGDKGALL